ncbi:MAG: alpha/beta hydrolase [Bacteroidota bacterium]
MGEIKLKYTNQHSRFLDIDHALVHYRDEGQGPPILLLHGTFASLHTFDGWVAELKSSYRLIRLDLPGFGLSEVTEDHVYSMERYIAVIKTLLDELGIERLSIAGSSLGGWLAWEFALDFPDLVERLILIDAAGVEIHRHIPLPVRLARLPFAKKFAPLFINRPTIKHFIREVYADPSKIRPEVIDRYYELFAREGNPEAFLAIVNSKFVDRAHELPKIQAPTMIIWGEQDNWLPISNAYHFLNVLPQAKLIIYEDLGHIPMEEAPIETAQDVKEFMQEVQYPMNSQRYAS